MELGIKAIVWVAAGGACGAVLRYGVQVWALRSQRRTATLADDSSVVPLVELSARIGALPLPWGTLLVNGIGCLAIGALTGACAGTLWFESVGRAFLVAGLLGAFTTFSAFSIETLALFHEGRVGWAAGYVFLSVAISLVAAFVGYRVAEALT